MISGKNANFEMKLCPRAVFNNLVLNSNVDFKYRCNAISDYFSLNHTIPTYNDPEKEVFRKHCEKRRKCWRPAFSLFPTIFSTLPC